MIERHYIRSIILTTDNDQEKDVNNLYFVGDSVFGFRIGTLLE